MNSLVVPFHFISAFVVTIAALGGLWVVLIRADFTSAGRAVRWAFAVGWLALAVGEFLHGAQFVSREPHALTVSLRAVAYFLLLGGVGLSIRKDLASKGRLVGALAALVVSEVLLVAVPGLHSGTPDLLWVTVHGLRLGGGLILLSWLWYIVRTSIQAKFIAIFVLLLLGVVVAISSVMGELFASNVAGESLRRAAREGQVQQGLLDAQVTESVSRARQVAELESVRNAVAARDPALMATVERLQGPGGPFDTSDFMAFVDEAGAILAISAKDAGNETTLDPSDALGLAGTEVVQSALRGRQAGSVDSIGQSKIALVGSFPIISPQGFDPPGAPQSLAGAVALGRIIDRDYLLDLRDSASSEAFVIGRDRLLLFTSPDPTGVLLQASGQRNRVFDQGQTVATRGVIGGTEYFNSYVPLRQTDNEVIAVLVLSQRSEVLQITQREVSRTIFLVALLATAAAVAASFFSGSVITRPIRELTHAADRVRAGDLSAQVIHSGPDEVGVLGQTFGEMTHSLSELTSELRDAALQQARLRSRLETILQSLTDGVVAVDDDGRIVAFNREAARIFGVSEEAALEQDAREVVVVRGPSGKKLDLPLYDLRTGSALGDVGKTEHPIPVEITSAPIRVDSGGPGGCVAVVRDLTPDVEVERMKSTFLSNVSHELRTPLTPIKGYADLLRRKQVPPEKAAKFLEGIAESASRLERIIEMLIDFSAMEAGHLTSRKVPVDLNEETRELVARWAEISPSHGFERKGFSRIPVVELDEKLVPLVLEELIDNAIKFSPKGGLVRLTASFDQGSKGLGHLSISVTDQGIGIEKTQLSTILQSFSQVDGSATRAYGGLGLGLAYVRRIVEGGGGRLEIQSQPGKGSRFTIVLPVGVPGSLNGTSAKKARRPVKK